VVVPPLLQKQVKNKWKTSGNMGGARKRAKVNRIVEKRRQIAKKK
jgi:hypothetical protein